MSDAFLLGAGFSKAICNKMPTMNELYELLEPLIGKADGFTREAYEYASGDAEALLSYYAIAGPQDDMIEVLRKRRITALIELGIGAVICEREIEGVRHGLNPRGATLISKWHEDKSHILTTNYDSIVERLAAQTKYTIGDNNYNLHYLDVYPIPITPANLRDGGMMFGSSNPDTFTLYKLHGSATWYTTTAEITFDQIYGLSYEQIEDPKYERFVGDKRRFIIPPVYDKSTLLNHASIRNLWWQAKSHALQPADRLYVIGYSLPETDVAMRTLLWEGRRLADEAKSGKKLLYVVDIDDDVCQRYLSRLGRYYDVRSDYLGGVDPFNRFVEDYISG